MITVYSELSHGSTFKIYLPAVGRQASQVGPKVKTRTVGGSETVLIAEDDPVVRQLSSRVLKEAGYTVLTAGEGAEALRVFEEHRDAIDLVMLDVVMPKMGGRAVYDRLHKEYPGIRFLFASGYSTNAVHTNFILEEGIELLQKPYAPDALLRKVREVLDKAQG